MFSSKDLAEIQVAKHKSGQLLLCGKSYLSQIPQILSSAPRCPACQSVLHEFSYVLTFSFARQIMKLEPDFT